MLSIFFAPPLLFVLALHAIHVQAEEKSLEDVRTEIRSDLAPLKEPYCINTCFQNDCTVECMANCRDKLFPLVQEVTLLRLESPLEALRGVCIGKECKEPYDNNYLALTLACLHEEFRTTCLDPCGTDLACLSECAPGHDQHMGLPRPQEMGLVEGYCKSESLGLFEEGSTEYWDNFWHCIPYTLARVSFHDPVPDGSAIEDEQVRLYREHAEDIPALLEDDDTETGELVSRSVEESLPACLELAAMPTHRVMLNDSNWNVCWMPHRDDDYVPPNAQLLPQYEASEKDHPPRVTNGNEGVTVEGSGAIVSRSERVQAPEAVEALYSKYEGVSSSTRVTWKALAAGLCAASMAHLFFY